MDTVRLISLERLCSTYVSREARRSGTCEADVRCRSTGGSWRRLGLVHARELLAVVHAGARVLLMSSGRGLADDQTG